MEMQLLLNLAVTISYFSYKSDYPKNSKCYNLYSLDTIIWLAYLQIY